VGVDAENGRIYLPQDEMGRFGVQEREIFGKEHTANFGRLMAFEAQRARSFYRDASVLPLPEERPALVAPEIMSAIYEDILNRIEKKNYHVFEKKIRVPAPAKISLALKAWWKCRR
jgi:15-cis-phytoene synthase